MNVSLHFHVLHFIPIFGQVLWILPLLIFTLFTMQKL